MNESDYPMSPEYQWSTEEERTTSVFCFLSVYNLFMSLRGYDMIYEVWNLSIRSLFGQGTGVKGLTSSKGIPSPEILRSHCRYRDISLNTTVLHHRTDNLVNTLYCGDIRSRGSVSACPILGMVWATR